MKKYNLLKVLVIMVFTTWLLTLFIPGSYADYTGKITESGITSNGIWGLFSNLNVSISYFNGIVLFIIAVSCFYAVLNKTKGYNELVSTLTKKFQNREKMLFIISTIIFSLLALFVSDATVLIAFMPFVYQIMKNINIDKKSILSSTIVATMIGSMCGIYNKTLFSVFSLELNTLLLVKVIVFFLSLIVLIIFTAPKKKTIKKEKIVKEEKNVKEEKVLKEETKQEKKKAPVKKSSKKDNTKKKAAPRKKVN